jgi:hypothetical protein
MRWRDALDQAGLPYLGPGSPYANRTALAAIATWELLRAGEPVAGAQLKACIEFIPAASPIWPRGTKTRLLTELSDAADVTLLDAGRLGLYLPLPPWAEVLTRVEGLATLAAADRKRGLAAVLAPPRLRLATIHRVKGEEADTVYLCPDLSRQTHEAYLHEPDDEHRVFYVAVTRARRALYVLPSESGNAYDFPNLSATLEAAS